MGREKYAKRMGELKDESKIFACKPTVTMISGSLPPRHVASSGCGSRNGLQYEG